MTVKSRRPATRFTAREVIDLRLLLHDKTHALGGSERVVALDKACRLLSARTTRTLYRGATQDEVWALQEHGTATFTGYLSFSEKAGEAVNFARQRGTLTVALASGARGFCLWRWLLAEYAKEEAEDPQAYEDNETQETAGLAKAEKEWVLSRETTLRVVKSSSRRLNVRQVSGRGSKVRVEQKMTPSVTSASESDAGENLLYQYERTPDGGYRLKKEYR